MADSRFAYLERPAISPGACAVCKNHARPVIDYRVNVPILGRLYVCVDCIDAANGLIPDETNPIDWEAKYYELMEEKDRLDGIIGSVSNLVNDWGWPDSDSESVPDSSVDPDESEDAGKDDKPARKKSGTSSKQGTDGVPSDLLDDII